MVKSWSLMDILQLTDRCMHLTSNQSLCRLDIHNVAASLTADYWCSFLLAAVARLDKTFATWQDARRLGWRKYQRVSARIRFQSKASGSNQTASIGIPGEPSCPQMRAFKAAYLITHTATLFLKCISFECQRAKGVVLNHVNDFMKLQTQFVHMSLLLTKHHLFGIYECSTRLSQCDHVGCCFLQAKETEVNGRMLRRPFQ